MHRPRRVLAVVVLGLAAALAVVTVRLLIDARQHVREGLAAERRSDTTGAVRHYLDAARLYVPWSPYVRQALDRLDAIGVSSVSAGDYATARAAFEAERAAILGARSLYTPHAWRLPTLEARLARLLAAVETRSASETFEERSQWHAERLARRPGPKTAYVLLALLGFGLWTTSAVVFFRKGLSQALVVNRAPALMAGAGFIVGLALFLVSLRLA